MEKRAKNMLVAVAFVLVLLVFSASAFGSDEVIFLPAGGTFLQGQQFDPAIVLSGMAKNNIPSLYVDGRPFPLGHRLEVDNSFVYPTIGLGVNLGLGKHGLVAIAGNVVGTADYTFVSRFPVLPPEAFNIKVEVTVNGKKDITVDHGIYVNIDWKSSGADEIIYKSDDPVKFPPTYFSGFTGPGNKELSGKRTIQFQYGGRYIFQVTVKNRWGVMATDYVGVNVIGPAYKPPAPPQAKITGDLFVENIGQWNSWFDVPIIPINGLLSVRPGDYVYYSVHYVNNSGEIAANATVGFSSKPKFGTSSATHAVEFEVSADNAGTVNIGKVNLILTDGKSEALFSASSIWINRLIDGQYSFQQIPFNGSIPSVVSLGDVAGNEKGWVSFYFVAGNQ